nr:MAG TPA: NTP-PPase-like protein [Caudoviricetes sp.]
MQTQKIDTYVRNSLEQAPRLKHLLEFEDAKLHPGMEPKLLNFACLGLAEEAGEVAGLATRELWKQIPQDPDHWLEELGDVLWYLTAAAACRGYTLEDLYNYNVKKLEDRYGK